MAVQGIALYYRVFSDWKGPVGTISNETFVPAIMIAAGRGFYVTDIDAVPGLRAFVDYQSAHFDVAAIPQEAALESPGRGYQWLRYMLYTVGYIWKIFGVSAPYPILRPRPAKFKVESVSPGSLT